MTELLEDYEVKSRQDGFDIDNMLDVLEHVGSRSQIHKQIGAYKNDISYENVRGYTGFQKLVQDIKYSLSDGVYHDTKQLERVIKALTKVGYKDNQLLTMFQNKVVVLISRNELRDELDSDQVNIIKAKHQDSNERGINVIENLEFQNSLIKYLTDLDYQDMNRHQ